MVNFNSASSSSSAIINNEPVDPVESVRFLELFNMTLSDDDAADLLATPPQNLRIRNWIVQNPLETIFMYNLHPIPNWMQLNDVMAIIAEFYFSMEIPEEKLPSETQRLNAIEIIKSLLANDRYTVFWDNLTITYVKIIISFKGNPLELSIDDRMIIKNIGEDLTHEELKQLIIIYFPIYKEWAMELWKNLLDQTDEEVLRNHNDFYIELPKIIPQLQSSLKRLLTEIIEYTPSCIGYLLDLAISTGVELDERYYFYLDQEKSIQLFSHIGYFSNNMLKTIRANYDESFIDYLQTMTLSTSENIASLNLDLPEGFSVTVIFKKNKLEILIEHHIFTFRDKTICVRGFFTVEGVKSFIEGMTHTLVENYCTNLPSYFTTNPMGKYFSPEEPVFFSYTHRNLQLHGIDLEEQKIHITPLLNFNYASTTVNYQNANIIPHLARFIEREYNHYLSQNEADIRAFQEKQALLRDNGITKIDYFPSIIEKIPPMFHLLKRHLPFLPKDCLMKAFVCAATDRVAICWKQHPDLFQQLILPTQREARSEYIAYAHDLNTYSNDRQIRFSRLNEILQAGDSVELPENPVDVSREEILADYRKLFSEENPINYLDNANEFQAMVNIFLSGSGQYDLNPETDADKYFQMKILFTHTYSAYKNKNPDELISFFRDVRRHYEFCSNGILKELWQHYYVNFPESISKNEGSFFAATLSKGLFELIDRLCSSAMRKRKWSKGQLIHLRNYIIKHMMKAVYIPQDPLAIGQDPENDRCADPAHFPDYPPDMLEQTIPNTALLPMLAIRLVQEWNLLIEQNDMETYTEVINKFIHKCKCENESIGILKEEIVQRRSTLREQSAALTALQQNDSLWENYLSTKEIFEAKSVAQTKKRRTYTSDHVSSCEILSEMVKVMESNAEIKRIIDLQKEIKENNTEINRLVKRIIGMKRDTRFELLTESGFLREDEYGMYYLTIKGALYWLEKESVVTRSADE